MESIGSVSQVASGQKKIGVEFITDMSSIGLWTGNIVVGLLEDFSAPWPRKAMMPFPLITLYSFTPIRFMV